MTLLLAKLPKLVACAVLVGMAGTTSHAYAQASLWIDDITVTHFRALDGHAMGTISGHTEDTQTPPSTVLLSSPDYQSARGTRQTPESIRPGPFRIPLISSLNYIQSVEPWLFISPSINGSGRQSPRVRYTRPIILPAPAITSAVGGEHTVRVTGTAARSARVQLELAGQQHTVTASAQDGGWSHGFSNVPGGQHWVNAQVVDITGQFSPSSAVRQEVQSEGSIIRPLVITSPADGANVKRNMFVAGVASPRRGTVRISVGGGSEVEASVNDRQHTWGAWVKSNAHGSVPLTVTLPYTGEQLTQTLQVAPFSDLTIERAVQRFPVAGEERILRLVAHGRVDLNSDDTQVQYLARGDDGRAHWKELTAIDEEGYWSYDGRYPTDIEASGGELDGVRYASLLKLNLPSDNGTVDNEVKSPLLRAAPELTSSRRVGRETVLEGIAVSGTPSPVEVTLPDGRRLSATPDSQQRWSLPVTFADEGRVVIELGTQVPEPLANRFETRSVTLDVVSDP